MMDDLLLREHSGHTHHANQRATTVLDVDGVAVLVSVDDDAVRTCGLRGGDCFTRQLDLKSAEPDDQWYIDNGHWDEEDDPEDEFTPRLEVDTYNLVGMATATILDGRPVAVTGGGRFDFSFGPDDDSSGGIVRTWDIGTGKMIGTIMTGHHLGVTSLTTVPYRQTRLAVSTCETGTTLAWDLDGNRRLCEIDGSYNGAMAAADVDGRPIAVTGGHDDFVQVWDLLTGRQLGEPLTGLAGAAWGIAMTTIGGRGAVVVTDDESRIHVWDLESREPLGDPLRGHTERIFTLTTAIVGERTIAVTVSENDELRLWDLSRGEQLASPVPDRSLVGVVPIAGSPAAVTQTHRGGVQAWDLTRV